MDDQQRLASRFEQHRPQLRAVAYRMLGSLTDADDAVQDTWERASRAGASQIDNISGWLITITARVCLNMLRSRSSRPEQPAGILPDAIVTADGQALPEDQALLSDSLGLALQIVLGTLSPAERVAFVLHDIFGLPFRQIAPIIGHTSQATRQLASRARRRIRDAQTPAPEPDPARQRAVVEAFSAAARAGDFDALIALLHPDVVLRADFSPGSPGRSTTVRGAADVARHAHLGARLAADVHPALVNGTAAVIITIHGRPFSILAFTTSHDKITQINAIGDPQRVASLAATVLGDHDLSPPDGRMIRGEMPWPSQVPASLGGLAASYQVGAAARS
jgi:RNA polymerase sigma factor (sigma-70 family)